MRRLAGGGAVWRARQGALTGVRGTVRPPRAGLRPASRQGAARRQREPQKISVCCSVRSRTCMRLSISMPSVTHWRVGVLESSPRMPTPHESVSIAGSYSPCRAAVHKGVSEGRHVAPKRRRRRGGKGGRGGFEGSRAPVALDPAPFAPWACLRRCGPCAARRGGARPQHRKHALRRHEQRGARVHPPRRTSLPRPRQTRVEGGGKKAFCWAPWRLGEQRAL